MRLTVKATRHYTGEGIPRRLNSGHLLLVAQRVRRNVHPSMDPL